jgi:hypothetical protein
MYRVFHKANAFNRLKHGVELSSPCRTKVRTNDLQSEQLPVLVRYAIVLYGQHILDLKLVRQRRRSMKVALSV